MLSRKIGDKILIGDDIKIVVTKISLNRVRIAVDAPVNVVIKREELCQEISECFTTKVGEIRSVVSNDPVSVASVTT
ncbi:Carbon storage regulator [Rhodopirellula sallentina SM41]|uniref:Carbon storage regulator n=1 Tax=Rhodopirellula sallentina SM41 TaxID=1263870 RepID=M5UEW9_9BACT|nr:Carbon storage regulator [Rhodopirellula sallentina SM41]